MANKSDFELQVAEAVKEALKEAIPAAAMAVAAANTQKPAQAPVPRSRGDRGPVCSECRQALAGCEGKHVELLVAPASHIPWPEYYPGYLLNGVLYISRNGRKVKVPANAAGAIVSQIERWCENERTLAEGRKRAIRSPFGDYK